MFKGKMSFYGYILVAIIVLLVVFLLSNEVGIESAYADDDISPFVGIDPDMSIEDKTSFINYESGFGNTTLLTVLIPDINEDASAWSNNKLKGGFSYNIEFLPERLKTSYSNVELYSACYENSKPYIYHISKYSYEKDKNKYIKSNVINSFSENVLKHRVILLSFGNKKDSFDNAYTEVNRIITLALYDLKKKTNLNATVNIIGHGRGGLLGIKYANNHPTTVNALYNIGTPHNGSKTIKLLQSFEQCGIDVGSIKNLLGESALYEIADSNSLLLSELKNEWNNTTIIRNPYIKAYAYAGVVNKEHFSAISDLTSIFANINSQCDVGDFIEEIIDNFDWANKYLGVGEANLLDSIYNNNRSIVGAFLDMNDKAKEIVIYDILKQSQANSSINELVNKDTITAGMEFLTNCYWYYLNNRQSDEESFLNYFDVYLSYVNDGEENFFIKGANIEKKEIAKQIYAVFCEKGISDVFILGFTIENGNVVYNTNSIINYLLVLFPDINQSLMDIIGLQNILEKISIITKDIASLIEVLPTTYGVIDLLGGFGTTFFINKLISSNMLDRISINGLNLQPIAQFLSDIKLRDNTDFDEDGFSWIFKDEILFMSDLIVDYDSQIAQGYQWFNYEKKIFTGDELNINKSSLFNTPLPIAHYLETMDPFFINKILEKIDINSIDIFDYTYILDDWTGEVTITGIQNESLKNNTSLVIPSEIHSNRVTRIAKGAFMGCLFSNVTLPEYLEEIDDEAFSKCINLSSVIFPSSIRKIGNHAFSGCQLVGLVNLGINVDSLGNMAFGICDISFNVNIENQYYASENGSLYNKNKTCLIKYGGTNNTFTVPSTVTTIGKYAFYGNQDLTNISLSNVSYIDEYAFYNSMVTIITNDSLLNYVGEMAFEGTPWLSNNVINGFVSLNGLLIRYLDMPGVTEVTIPGNITRIISKAFKGSYIECVSIPSNVEVIYGRIFEDCLNMEKVKFIGYTVPSVEGLLTDGIGNNQLKIYVPYSYHEYYEYALSYLYDNNGPFNYIYKVRYYDITSITYYEEDEFTNDGSSLTLRSSAANTGGTFVGWSDNPDTFHQVQEINSASSDICLYAFYQYTITFELNNGEPDVVYNVIYNESVNVPTPIKEGYNFSNWHNNTNMGSYPAYITSIQLIENDNWVISALWLPYRYELTIEDNGTWWIYVDGNSTHPLLSSEQHFVNLGDEINISELVTLFKINGIGVKEGHTLVGFSFDEPIGGPSNAAPIGQNDLLTIPYLGEDSSVISVGEWEDNGIPNPNNAPSGSMNYQLYAIYDIETYYINFFVNNQFRDDLSHEYEYGELLENLGYINNLHSDFIKWSTQPISILSPSASNPAGGYNTAIIYDFTPNIDLCLSSNNSLSLYAVLKRRCEVVFKDNEGSILKTEYVQYGQSATPPTAPSKSGYTFLYWQNNYLNVTTEYVQCIAIYRRNFVITGANQTITFSDKNVYVNCSANIDNVTYVIGPNVNVITFEDTSSHNGMAIFNKIQHIEIQNRTTAIDIYLINYYAKAQNNCSAILGSGVTINLHCRGESNIMGGIVTTTTISDNTSTGIYANTINISGDSGARLLISGGNGEAGASGYSYNQMANANTSGANGGNGSVGKTGGYGVVCNNLRISNIYVSIEGGKGGEGGSGGKGQQAGDRTGTPGYGVVGGTGYNGGNGGTGGNGGLGRSAVVLNGGVFQVDASASVSLWGGRGGNGGSGGTGGKGGKGQKGGPGKLGKHAAKGGKGGRGGNGGSGGTGGSALSTITNNSGSTIFLGSVIVSNATSGYGGYGGNGGSGGAGGEGGNKWPTGNLAETGAQGDAGSNGSNGTPWYD